MEKFHKFENVARSMCPVDYTKVFAVDVLEKSTRELCENATNSRKLMTTALESGVRIFYSEFTLTSLE